MSLGAWIYWFHVIVNQCYDRKINKCLLAHIKVTKCVVPKVITDKTMPKEITSGKAAPYSEYEAGELVAKSNSSGHLDLDPKTVYQVYNFYPPNDRKPARVRLDKVEDTIPTQDLRPADDLLREEKSYHSGELKGDAVNIQQQIDEYNHEYVGNTKMLIDIFKGLQEYQEDINGFYVKSADTSNYHKRLNLGSAPVEVKFFGFTLKVQVSNQHPQWPDHPKPFLNVFIDVHPSKDIKKTKLNLLARETVEGMKTIEGLSGYEIRIVEATSPA